MTMTVKKDDTAIIPGDMVLLPKEKYNRLMEAWEKLQFLHKIDHSLEQSKNGQVVVKTMEELEEMANG
ncbi:MAG: hypothetical protein IJ679_08280 [Lachnospiraceae bacterium]|nr:hypothetical protein [Lachnospiraceae bacterium]